MGTVGVSFTSKKAFKKPQAPAKGADGKVLEVKYNAAPKHDKSYNHNTAQLKKGVMDKLSKRKVYLS